MLLDRSSHRTLVRVVAASAIALVLAVSLASGAGAAAPPKGRFGVGDSIMLSAKDELRPLGYGVNAVVGRQFGAGVWLVRRMAEDGTLPRRVVVHLGTNGTVDPGDCDRLIGYVGPARRIFLVTIKVPRSWETPNNDELNACASRHEKVHVIRWWAHSHDHPEWFSSDGYHLNADGQDAYASFVDRSVDVALAELRVGVARLDSTRWPARAAEGTRLESV